MFVDFEFLNLFINGITALATCFLAYYGSLGLNSWKQSLKYEKEKLRMEKIQELNEIVLLFDDVFKRLIPSYGEIPELLKKIEPIKPFVSSNKELGEALNKFCNSYNFIHYFLNVFELNKENKSESMQKELAKIMLIYQDTLNKIISKTNVLKNLITKELT